MLAKEIFNERKIFIHPGWNKTGTTFLQNNVFMPIFDKGLIGPGIALKDLKEKTIDRDIPLLISDESLLGVTIKRNKYIDNRISRLNFLHNWARICPETQFIICIRKHEDFLESLYRQFLHVGGDVQPEEFIDTINNDGFIKVEELLYEPILKKLLELFPNPHLIWDFDLLKSNSPRVIKELILFLGLDLSILDDIMSKKELTRKDNRSVEYFSGLCLRYVNKIVASQVNPNKPIPLSLFKFLALGRSPRQIFQNLRLNQAQEKFTTQIYEKIENDLSYDWNICQKYLTINLE